MNIEPGHGLCFRCENRSIFHETGRKPRYECGESRAVHSCYMFTPTKPIAVGLIPWERRPIFGPWMLAGRIQSYGLVDRERLRLKLVDIDGHAVAAVWTIKPNKKIKKANMGAERNAQVASGKRTGKNSTVPAPSPFDPALIRGLNNGAAALRRTRVQAKKMGISIG